MKDMKAKEAAEKERLKQEILEIILMQYSSKFASISHLTNVLQDPSNKKQTEINNSDKFKDKTTWKKFTSCLRQMSDIIKIKANL